ncbi:MAG: response regulator [Planctomycetota bacterium]
MKLSEISADTVRLAIDTYQRLAYSDQARWRAPSIDLDGGESATDLLDRFNDEGEVRRGRFVHRYVMRLGNERYPHMKLVLEESILVDQYVFRVDTHDDLRVDPEAPDFERWTRVREHNQALRLEIEQEWKREGVPVLSDIKAMLGKVEQLTPHERSVLIVDDDDAIRETIQALLERAGLKVRTACDGERALDQVRSEPPHLILMDYEMPGMDGVTCCERLKENPDTRHIPVLLATAGQVDLSTLTYADGFLVKPYRRDILFSLVRKLLS